MIISGIKIPESVDMDMQGFWAAKTEDQTAKRGWSRKRVWVDTWYSPWQTWRHEWGSIGVEWTPQEMPENIVSMCYREPSPAPLLLKGVPSSLSIHADLLWGSPGQDSRLLHTSVAQLLSFYCCVFSLWCCPGKWRLYSSHAFYLKIVYICDNWRFLRLVFYPVP